MNRNARLWGLLVALACSVAATAPSALASDSREDADVVRDWNSLAFAAVRADNASDAQAARMYAMVNAAMYDAVNTTRGGGGPPRAAALAVDAARAGGDPAVAAAAAAHDVLAQLSPAHLADYDTQLAHDVAAASSHTQVERGLEHGADIAAQVLAARANDGSSPPFTLPAGSGIGIFNGPFAGAQFRNLSPFVIADPGGYAGAGPPPLTSPEYAAAFDTVKGVGALPAPGTATPDDDAKKAIYDYWSLGGRTDQPPGAWMQIAQIVSASQSLSLRDTARLFALESMALADTVAPTYATKFAFRHWRPAAAIPQAGLDGNPATEPDPSWKPRAFPTTGTSPEYWSGHSSFSAAAATVLAGFFCDDAIGFTLTTDSAPGGVPRTYDSFSQAAAEAGISRILGGLHFPFSNTDGLVAGRAIGAEVLGRALLREHGPTHRAGCPR